MRDSPRAGTGCSRGQIQGDEAGASVRRSAHRSRVDELVVSADAAIRGKQNELGATAGGWPAVQRRVLPFELENLAELDDRPAAPKGRVAWGDELLVGDGFAVPLLLRAHGEQLALLTTLAHFSTAIDVEVSELTLEAFLPADTATAAFFTRSAAGDDGGGRDDV